MTIERNYEAMFILENNAANADFEQTAGAVDAILEKHGASLVRKDKWDERKLAYEIKGQRRGTYYLVYFTAPPSGLAGMAEDLQLTELVLRHMFIVLDEPIDDYIAEREAERERLAEESRRSSLGWGGGGGGRRSRGAPPPKTAAPKDDLGDDKPASKDESDGDGAEGKDKAKPADAKPGDAKAEDAKAEDAKAGAKAEDAAPAEQSTPDAGPDGDDQPAEAQSGGGEASEKEAASKP
jgi:small subunit ribosomal protein S6